MGVIRRLDQTGDTALATWHDEITTEQANVIFDQLVAEGALLFRADKGTDLIGEKIREFDPEAEQIIVVQNFAGG